VNYEAKINVGPSEDVKSQVKEVGVIRYPVQSPCLHSWDD
jgi:hypothetical protein